jgi:hypothetical protein
MIPPGLASDGTRICVCDVHVFCLLVAMTLRKEGKHAQKHWQQIHVMHADTGTEMPDDP